MSAAAVDGRPGPAAPAGAWTRSFGLIPRPRLVHRLLAAADVPVVLLVAPAGYGKTVLLHEWERVDERPFAWVGQVGAGDAARLRRSVAGALADATGATVVVMDGGHAPSAPGCMAGLAEVLDHLGEGDQLALACRGEPPLGLGGMRARCAPEELRPADLAMTGDEADALVRAHGLDLDPDELERLVAHTEGWPAGLRLAVLAARAEPHRPRALARFAGDDRFMADYFRDEVLAHVSAEEMAFLERSSILDTLSGPKCDRVLGRTGSARMLERLARRSVMVVPLDRGGRRYRYHRLFAEALQAELRRSEPGVEAALHARASAWYAEQDDLERSVEHAIDSGDAGRAGELLWAHAPAVLGCGRAPQLWRWLGRFGEEQIAACPKLSLTAAAAAFVAGDRHLLERWSAAALRGLDGASGDSRAVRAEAALLHATVSQAPPDRLGHAAAAALADLAPDSRWRALGGFLEGVARHLTGNGEGAWAALEEGARAAGAGSPHLQSLCLAQLALLAIERDDRPAGEALAARARAHAERGLGGYATSALAYAVSAEAQAHAGRVDAARADMRDAERLLSALTDFSAWYEAECRVALARAALRLSEVPRARVLIEDARAQLRRAPGTEVAHGWVESAEAQADRVVAASPGAAWALTAAELRILQFLPTHLSFPEMAERLFVSANTVKTHTRGVYRKLGASSRGEAVLRARAAGLLDQASHAGVAAAVLADLTRSARSG